MAIRESRVSTPPQEQRRLQIYTGNGKGKTTAALGLSLRALGAGWRVFFGQFLKAGGYSEIEALRNFPGRVVVESFGLPEFCHPADPLPPQQIEAARRGLDRSREALFSGEFDLVVLDELNVSVHFRLLPEAEVLELLKRRPPNVELVVTGRYAPDSFIEEADLVTEMREVKHYYTEGLQARKGVEF